MLRLLCDDGYRLDARRARSNDSYSQSGEINAFMGPKTGMIPLAFEPLQTRVVRRPRRRKIACRHDAKTRGRGIPFISLHRPGACLTIEGRLLDPGVELDVAPEVKAVGHMVDVSQDLRLRAVALRPMPFLLQLVGKGIRILHAFDVAATPWITVPVPGTTNTGAGLEGAHSEAEFAQSINRVETADSSADDNRIEFLGF